MGGISLLLLIAVSVMALTPIIIGISTGVFAQRFTPKAKSTILGLAFGAMIFSLLDLFRGASGLGVDFGFSSPFTQILLLLSFALGLFLPKFLNRSPEISSLLYPFAIVIGFHSFGEGIVIGYDISVGYGFPIIDRGIQSLSFILHKGAEGLAISIPILFSKYVSRKTLAYATLLSGGPLIVGTILVSLGISGSFASFSFAAGVGGLTFMLLQIGKILGKQKESDLIYFGLFAGILYMYLAGVIHGI